MRTQRVPTCASAKGSSAERDGDQRDAGPDQRIAPVRASRSGAVPDALAEQARRPEHEHEDQHDEREHVLVVGAEQDEVAAALAVVDARRAAVWHRSVKSPM